MDQYNDLNHSGVLGMKWGKRKALPQSAIKKKFDKAKQEKNEAHKQFSRDYDKARNNPLNSFTKKGQQRWEKAVDSAEKSNEARDAYKAVKKERRKTLNKTFKEVNKQTSFGEKMLYSPATRKLAAKYIVDNDMPMEQARKKASEKALRNTAMLLAAYGTTLVVMSKVQ